MMQSYTAVTVIDYTYKGAENGLAPDGTPLLPADIYSPSVISKALDNLGLSQERYPIDSIRSAITVEQIEDASVAAVNEAINKEGETSNLQSTVYLVSYTVKNGEGSEVASAILNEIIDVYFTEFSTQYVNRVTVDNTTSAVNQGGYDYIEQMELLEEALETAVERLRARAEASPDFYSVSTGYSFHELMSEFQLLKSTKSSALFSYILRHRVTKDLDVLIAKYEERMVSSRLEQENSRVRLEKVEGILDSYVEKVREIDDTANASYANENGEVVHNSNVLQNVEYPDYQNEEGEWIAYDQTTEYDSLLKDWIAISDSYNRSIVATEYNQYILDCFQGNDSAVISYQNDVARIGVISDGGAAALPETAGDGGAAALPETAGDGGEEASPEAAEDDGGEVPPETVEEMPVEPAAGIVYDRQVPENIYTETTVPCTQEDRDYVEQGIADLIARMDVLYAVTANINTEYNEYLAPNYIQILSSTKVVEAINIGLYTAIGAVLFLGIGCFGAVLLGRVGDIVEYVAFFDHKYQLPNRTSCDQYIEKYKDMVLPPHFACLYLKIINQNELNDSLGREGADAIFKTFAACLKSLFEGKGDFVGYNGGMQFIVFTRGVTSQGLDELLEHFRVTLKERFKGNQAALRYSAGTAVASDVEKYQIRGLLTEAIKQDIQYEV